MGRLALPAALICICTVALGCSDDQPNGNDGSAGTNTGGSASAGNAGSGGGSGSGGGIGTTAGTSAGGLVGSGGSGTTSNGGSSNGGSSNGGSSNGGSGNGGTSAGGTTGSAGTGTSGGSGSGGGGNAGKSKTTFFVTSDTSKTGNLGGLAGADKRCQDLAVKAGLGDHTFRAYLSTSTENAKDRIGQGPWVNSKGVTLAADLAALHASTLKGDHALFIDEYGSEIDGQWNSSPEADFSTATGKTNQHDIFTGSKPDGTVQAGATCQDWTSEAEADKGQVGHSDGTGPGMNTTGNYGSWNSSHAGGSCAATWKAGGAGRIYCFAVD